MSPISYFEIKPKAKVVSLSTQTLRQELNHLYESYKTSTRQAGFLMDPSNNLKQGLFTTLWDLKEKALLQGKSTVDVPQDLLSDLETSLLALDLVNK